jgi:protein gp37
VPYFFKQWGAWKPAEGTEAIAAGRRHRRHLGDGLGYTVHVGKRAAGRELDGRTHDEYPR